MFLKIFTIFFLINFIKCDDLWDYNSEESVWKFKFNRISNEENEEIQKACQNVEFVEEDKGLI